MLRDVNRFKMFPELLVAHADHALLLTGVHGRIEKGLEGFYRHQTRFLSKLTFTVNGHTPAFVSANPVDPYSFIAYYHAAAAAGRAAGPDPEDRRSDGGEIVEKGIEVQINRFVGGGMHQDMLVTNHTLAEAEVAIAWAIDADFADLTEAVENRRTQTAEVERQWALFASYGELSFHYMHPALKHGTVLRFPREDAALAFEGDQVVVRLTLAPQETKRQCLDVLPIFSGELAAPNYHCDAFRSHRTPWDEARDDWAREVTKLKTSSGVVQDAWDRAVSDLGSLPLYEGRGAERYTPAAGLPIYQALFGRDTLTAAWQSSLLSPLMLQGTIELLARHIGTKVDDRFDEQPGRMIHQRQLSPLSLLGQNPYLHYWGDYAGPGLFLVAVAWHYSLTGDKAFVRKLRDPVMAVLEWIDREADRDGDGFYEYATRAGDWGTKNQGWKDSEQAILYADGKLVNNPIAVVEIQGYYFAAKQLMGLTFLALGEVATGRRLLAEAAALKQRFNERFWMPDRGFYALALDPEKRQVRSIASNAGHCLACGIVDADKAEAVARRLMAPDMFSGWGIRTLSRDHPAYNPFAYHLGSVWPSENGSMALGLKRYGFHDLTNDLVKGVLDATLLFDHSRLPEVIGGHPRDAHHPHPGIYRHANAPQAWSASAVVLMIQAMLGLVVLAPANTLVVDPVLPEWLPELTLEHVPVGRSRISLRFERDASGHTGYEILASRGHPRVLRQPALESVTAGVSDRILGVLSSLLPH